MFLERQFPPFQVLNTNTSVCLEVFSSPVQDAISVRLVVTDCGLITPPPKLVHNYCMFVSLHDSDHVSVRSQNLCSPFLRAVRLFIYIIYLITLINYITRHNFSPTRSVMTVVYIHVQSTNQWSNN